MANSDESGGSPYPTSDAPCAPLARSRREPIAQPFTPSGLAAFSRASINRLCLFQSFFAFFSAGVVTWCLAVGLFPVIQDFVGQLPDTGELRNGQLVLDETATTVRAANDWLSIAMDAREDISSTRAVPTGFEISLGRRTIQFCSLLGCLGLPYPPLWRAPFNRVELVPVWEAWRSVSLAGLGFAIFCCLIICWWVLATLYCWLPKLFAFLANRVLSFSGAWKIAAASLLPSALLAGMAMLGGVQGWISGSKSLGLFALHLIAPFVFMGLAVSTLPRYQWANAARMEGNPFVVPRAGGEAEPPKRGSNPFA